MSKNVKNENKDVKKKFHLSKIKDGIVDFSKLLWACITWKLILLIVAAAFVGHFFLNFKSSVQKQINKSTRNYLSSMVTESLEKMRLKINDEYSVISTLALLFDDNDEIGIDNASEILEKEMDAHDFVGIDLIAKDSSKILSVGASVMYDEDFIGSILSGSRAISTIIVDDKKGAEYICMGVPVYMNGRVNGALICEYDIKEFSEIIDTSLFGKVGTTFISQEDGILVLRPESAGGGNNLFVLLDSINIDNEKSIKKLKKSIKNGQSGVITYGSGKHKRYICYDIVPDTDWYSVSIVSSDAIEPITKKVSTLAFNFALKISIIFVLYVIIVLTIDIRMAKRKRKL